MEHLYGCRSFFEKQIIGIFLPVYSNPSLKPLIAFKSRGILRDAFRKTPGSRNLMLQTFSTPLQEDNSKLITVNTLADIFHILKSQDM
jgi:hypothetical protein